MAKIKWLHISDIHIKPPEQNLENYNFDVILRALWKDIEERTSIDKDLQEIDFCFITGDISFTSAELDEAFKLLIKPLSQLLGLPLSHIYIVPGNHDNDRNTITPEIKLIEKKLKTRDRINELLVDKRFEANKSLIFNRQINYRDFIIRKFKHISLTETNEFFKIVKTKSGVKIKIIGLNSAWLSFGGKEDQKKLALNEPFIQSLSKKNEKSDYTLTLVHHPLKQNTDWFKEIERNTINQVISKSDFILSGHVHAPETINFLIGEFIELVSGSVYDGRYWTSNCYNFVVFDTQKNIGKSFIRKYEDNTLSGPGFLPGIEYTIDKNGIANLSLQRKDELDFTNDDFFLDSFLKKQMRVIQNRPLLYSLENKLSDPSMDFLFPDVYIDPLVRLKKHPNEVPIKLTEWFSKEYTSDKKILILGQAGSGKTTSLIRINQIISKNVGDITKNRIPLFCEARDFEWNKKLEFSSTIDLIKLRYELTENESNHIFNENRSFVLLLDALDESFSNLYDANILSPDSYILDIPHIATSRVDFYERSLNSTEYYSNYDEILIIEPWALDREVKEFLEKYLTKSNNTEIKADEIISLIDSTLPYIPLTITAILFLRINNKDMVNEKPIKSLAVLLDKFLEVWAEREVSRDKACFENKLTLLVAYEIVAWEMFKSVERKVSLNFVAKIISKKLGLTFGKLIIDRGFISMFKTNKYLLKGDELYITSFVHETIYEFLVAQRIVKALTTMRHNDDILTKLLGHSINRLAREYLESKELGQKITLVELLSKYYYKSLRFYSIYSFLIKIFGKTICRILGIVKLLNEGIVKRHNICYYWGRLESHLPKLKIAILFEKIYNKEIKDHELVISTVGSSMILLNVPDQEEKYLSIISNNSSSDICNRVYHLVYYGDAKHSNPDDFIIEPSGSWIKTKNAIIKRLESNGIREQMLRSLDLVTIKRFFETFKSSIISKEEYKIINDCVSNLDLEADRILIIRKKHKELIDILSINE
jgi:DNA repair exonuclease SbcCD nuclease subunit